MEMQIKIRTVAQAMGEHLVMVVPSDQSYSQGIHNYLDLYLRALN